MATTLNPVLAKETVSPIRLSEKQYALVMDVDAGQNHLHGWGLINADNYLISSLSSMTDPQYLLLLGLFTRLATDKAFCTSNITWAKANLPKIKNTLAAAKVI